MPKPVAVDVALRFVARINDRDVDGIAALMTDDHVFIDSLGAKVAGREAMRCGWQEYLGMVPDYRIEVEQTFAEGTSVVLVGRALGTLSRHGTLRAEDAWTTPAAWRAVIRGNLVAEWQVYADNQPIRRIAGSPS